MEKNIPIIELGLQMIVGHVDTKVRRLLEGKKQNRRREKMIECESERAASKKRSSSKKQ